MRHVVDDDGSMADRSSKTGAAEATPLGVLIVAEKSSLDDDCKHRISEHAHELETRMRHSSLAYDVLIKKRFDCTHVQLT